jgi:HEAT repeat protein
LGDERARPTLERLLDDDLADVRTAAEFGLRELDEGPDRQAATADAAEAPQLKPEALAALQQLRLALGGEGMQGAQEAIVEDGD